MGSCVPVAHATLVCRHVNTAIVIVIMAFLFTYGNGKWCLEIEQMFLSTSKCCVFNNVCIFLEYLPIPIQYYVLPSFSIAKILPKKNLSGYTLNPNELSVSSRGCCVSYKIPVSTVLYENHLGWKLLAPMNGFRE